MRKERMTVEELNSLNPSYENQIRMVCDDGFFKDMLKVVRVISPCVGDRFSIITNNESIDYLPIGSLAHYPSLRPEKKRWFQFYVQHTDGNIALADFFCDENFKCRNGEEHYAGLRKALGREVTDEIEKLEWK